MRHILSEATPSEQARALGLTYGGFGGWIDPKSRKVVARTVSGKLVKVGDQDGGDEKPDLGRLNVLCIEPTIIQSDEQEPSDYIKKYTFMIKLVIKRGGEFILLCDKGAERAIADFLRRNGIRTGLKLQPIGTPDPTKIHDFIQQKIDDGYTNIQYFDFDERNTSAVDSLKATYNKIENLNIKTHLMTRMDSGHDDVVGTQAKAA